MKGFTDCFIGQTEEDHGDNRIMKIMSPIWPPGVHPLTKGKEGNEYERKEWKAELEVVNLDDYRLREVTGGVGSVFLAGAGTGRDASFR